MTEELNISDMTDEQLVDLIVQEHGERYANELIKRYIPIVRVKAAKMAMRCPSADKDDLFQRGLWDCLRQYGYIAEKRERHLQRLQICVPIRQ